MVGPGVLDAPGENLEWRIGAATLAGIARVGLTKLTVDDVARAAGTSRATVYRLYPSKRAVVAAAVTAEADRITGVIVRAATSAADLDDAVARIVLTAGREARACAALRFVVTHEPDLVFPHLAFAGGDRLLQELGRRCAPALAPWCTDPARAAEWVARCVLTLLWSTEPLVDLADEAAVRRFVTSFVTPGIPKPGIPRTEPAFFDPEEG